MGNLAFRPMSKAEFIAWETRRDRKHEYLDGATLVSHLRGTGCRLFGPDRIRTSPRPRLTLTFDAIFEDVPPPALEDE